MKLKKITHKVLDPDEYYCVTFYSKDEVQNFCNTCTWFDKDDAINRINENLVIKYNKEAKFYQIYTLSYLRAKFKKYAEIYAAVYQELMNS